MPYNDDDPNTNLRPCPFCGEQHELKVITDIHFGKCHAIICHGRVLLEAYNARQLIVAAEAWNTRPIEDALRGELAQKLEDQMLAQVAMIKAYYGCLMIEAHGGQIPLIELKAAMQAIETALRITPGYWPECS